MSLLVVKQHYADLLYSKVYWPARREEEVSAWANYLNPECHTRSRFTGNYAIHNDEIEDTDFGDELGNDQRETALFVGVGCR